MEQTSVFQRTKKWIIATMAPLLMCSQGALALFISQDSMYGNDSITLDTSTGLEWIDPALTVTLGGSGPNFNSYSHIADQLSMGGFYEGFRFAKQDELEHLIFDTAYSWAAAQNVTGTSTSAVANNYLMSFFGSTYGWAYGPDHSESVLDAVYDIGSSDNIGRALIWGGNNNGLDIGGELDLVTVDPDIVDGSWPIGFWLVRDSNTTAVPEPSSFLFATGMLFLLLGRKRNKLSSY